MIPKIIHYCWFGKSPLPKLAKECIQSWKKYCPDFVIKEWNETNSPIHLFPFAEQALKDKKWAFVSDVIRLYALYTEGGIYMDTDVELMSPLYPFLNHRAFTGYEKDSNMLQTAIFGAEPQSQWIADWLKLYNNLSFSSERNIMATLVNNRLISKYLIEKGIDLDGKLFHSDYITIYPHDYFCPMSYGTHFITKTPNTICIHYYTFSWSEPETVKGYMKKVLTKYLGEKLFRKYVNKIRSILYLRKH